MGLVGEGALVTTVLSDVFPMIDVESPRKELAKLAGLTIAVGGENLAPGAANRATMGFTNPADSGIVAVITRLTYQSSAVQSVAAGWIGFPNTIVENAVNRVADSRQAPNYPNESPVCFVGSSNTDPLNAAWWSLVEPANGFFHRHSEDGIAVLGPGTTWGIRGTTNNITLRCTFEWRERPAEPSEFV